MERDTSNSRVSIRLCPVCRPHKFQDEEHGKNRRVHNATGKQRIDGWRCTVCGDKKLG